MAFVSPPPAVYNVALQGPPGPQGPPGIPGTPGMSATAGGATTQLQFNDAGAFAGDSAFTVNKTTGQVGIEWKSGGFGTGGLKLTAPSVTGGTVVLAPVAGDMLYIMNGSGAPGGLNLGTWTNPNGGTFTASTGAWTISSGVLSLPAGAVGAPSLNFGTATNGIYGTASTLFFSIGGAQRFAVWGSIIDHNVVCRFTGGSATATSLHFGTNGTGIFGGAASVSVAAGAVEIARWEATGIVLKPQASVTPAANGEMMFQLTSNTSLAIKVKGSDGVVRTATLTLA